MFFFLPTTRRNGNPEIVEEMQISGRNLVSIDTSANGEKEMAAYYYPSASGGSANYPELALLASIQPIAGQQQQQQQGSSVQTPVQGTSSVNVKTDVVIIIIISYHCTSHFNAPRAKSIYIFSFYYYFSAY